MEENIIRGIILVFPMEHSVAYIHVDVPEFAIDGVDTELGLSLLKHVEIFGERSLNLSHMLLIVAKASV